MTSPELLTPMLMEEHNQRISAAQQIRALRAGQRPGHPLTRWIARPLGRLLLRTGARLLRYSTRETALGVEV